MKRSTYLLLVLYSFVGQSPAAQADQEPGSDNAATHYRKAFSLLPKFMKEEQEILSNVRTAPLDEKALELIRRCEPSLEWLHRGATVKQCDWELDYAKSGFERMIDLSATSRLLMQAVCLKARHQFRQGNPVDAVNHLTDLLRLAHHLGGREYTSKLIQLGIELTIIDVATAALTPIQEGTLKALEKLCSVPRSSSFKETLLMEKEFDLKWYRPKLDGITLEEAVKKFFPGETDERLEAIRKAAGGTIEGLRKITDESRKLYDELADIMAMPKDRRGSALDEFKTKHGPKDLFAVEMVKDLERVVYADARVETRWAMLRAAIAVIRNGPEQLKTLMDPFDDKPFDYRPLEGGGFELKSRMIIGDGSSVILAITQKP